MPLIGDATTLQVAINRVLRCIELGMIDGKKATAELYALQLASMNLSRLREELPSDPAATTAGTVGRIMRILDPATEKYAYVMQEVMRLVDQL